MSIERMEFAGFSGNLLAARLEKSLVPQKSVALFAHCFTCSKDLSAARKIAGKLASLGISVFRFDFTGLGNSEGDFADTNFSSNVEDLVLAAKFLQEKNLSPSLLIGHSLGGAAVLKAANMIDSIKAVVTIGAPADPSHVAHNFGDSIQEIGEKGEAKVSLGGRKFNIKKQFIDDIKNASIMESIANLNRALLVLHAPLDSTVGIENAAEIFGAAKHPKSFVSLDDADHLLSRNSDAEYAASVIAAWSTRYIETNIAETKLDSKLPDNFVRSSEIKSGEYAQFIQLGSSHSVVADEPESMGGNNTGATPYHLLSAALSACTSITIRIYAKFKKLPLDHVSVEVSHSKVHADDSRNCETQAIKIDQFVCSIKLQGDLTPQQREGILRVAHKCPVHRTLTSNADIKCELA